MYDTKPHEKQVFKPVKSKIPSNIRGTPMVRHNGTVNVQQFISGMRIIEKNGKVPTV